MAKTALPEISVVIPVYNERDNVGPLAREIDAALAGTPYEMIFVNDCSTDDTLERLKAARPFCAFPILTISIAIFRP